MRSAGLQDVPETTQIAVVGGGIAGLAAAWHLLQNGGPGVRVTLLESSPRLGGKLRTGEVGGLTVDIGAESMLARRPEAVTLAREVGLTDRLEPPRPVGASVWTRGALRPMPRGHVMGVPGSPEAVAGVLSAAGLARLAEDRALPVRPYEGDVSVGDFVASRLGNEVVDRLVEPLLGGVYAGDAYKISLAAAVPQLLPVAHGGGSLLDGVEALLAKAPPNTTPVFQGIHGGIGSLPTAVADAIRASGRALVRTGATVRELNRTPNGWQLVVGDIRTPEFIDFDAVILATPAAPTARLLRPHASAAADFLAGVEYSSMALTTFAFRRSDVELSGSGFLVPAVDDRRIKASTFSSNKWSWNDDPDVFVLRTSAGRAGDVATLQRPDAELASDALAELKEAVGLTAPPLDTIVTRWGGGLPQYAVGHVDKMTSVRSAVTSLPGVAVCGAAYDGVGIPACIKSARAAADQVLGTPSTT